jgi:hypothetical protein
MNFVFKTLEVRSTHGKCSGGQYCGNICEAVKVIDFCQTYFDEICNFRCIEKILRCFSSVLPPQNRQFVPREDRFQLPMQVC